MKKRIPALFLSTVTVFAAESGWNTNLEGLTSATNKPAKITYSEKGVSLSRINENDGLAVSKTRTAGDFILESDVTFTAGNVANLVFGAEKSTTVEKSFIFKLDRNNAQCLFADSLTPELGKTYHVELTYKDGKLTYVFGGVTVFEEVVDANSDVSFTGGRVGRADRRRLSALCRF